MRSVGFSTDFRMYASFSVHENVILSDISAVVIIQCKSNYIARFAYFSKLESYSATQRRKGDTV